MAESGDNETGDRINNGAGSIFGGDTIVEERIGGIEVESSPSSTGEGPKLNKDGTPRKRRGPKSATSTGNAKVSTSLKGFESLFLGVHSLLAEALKIPEIAITQTQAETVISALENVSRHYPNYVPSEKMQDWTNLVTVLSITYGTRYHAYKERVNAEPKRPSGENVRNVDFTNAVRNPIIGGDLA